MLDIECRRVSIGIQRNAGQSIILERRAADLLSAVLYPWHSFARDSFHSVLSAFRIMRGALLFFPPVLWRIVSRFPVRTRGALAFPNERGNVNRLRKNEGKTTAASYWKPRELLISRRNRILRFEETVKQISRGKEIPASVSGPTVSIEIRGSYYFTLRNRLGFVMLFNWILVYWVSSLWSADSW